MKKSLLLLLLLAATNVTAQISDDIQADRYLLQAKSAIDNQNYPQAVEYLQKITRLNVNPPADFYYFYAYALYKNGNLNDALKNVKLYIEISGKYGENYQQALELWNNIENPTTMYDSRDGKTYKIVRIGTQTWMAENLNYNTSDSWCYDNSSSNCDKYGRLYTWQAARSACPPGWHLPSDAEWTQLVNYLGGEDVAGGKLKSTSLWNSPNTGATNSSGFSAFPGGYRTTNGTFRQIGNYGYWWTSAEYSSNAWYRSMYYDYGEVGRDYSYYPQSYGFSVRCVRD